MGPCCERMVYGPTWSEIATHLVRLGPVRSFKKIFFMNIFKVGQLVGRDQFGNEYVGRGRFGGGLGLL